MDPSQLMSMLGGMGNGSTGGMPAMPGMGGGDGKPMSPAEMKSMQALIEAMTKGDPEMKKQIEGYWKMLDGMSQDNPDEYKKFIDSQMKEMKEYEEEEKKQEDEKFSIQSEAYFVFSVKPAQIHEQK